MTSVSEALYAPRKRTSAEFGAMLIRELAIHYACTATPHNHVDYEYL
jgi:hypothetical protein